MNRLFWNSWGPQTLLLAIVYYLTGTLGLLWAMPPGYASPVWPPSGLGIAALLLFGINRWPGIFIGSFFIAYADSGSISDVGPWVGIGIGIGNTLSLVLACLIIKRGLGYPKSFYREKDFIPYLFIAGPFAGFISATVGASTLLLLNQIPSTIFSLNWLHWFVGDATGGIIFSPLALIFSIKSRNYWTKSIKTVLIPLLIFFSLILVVINFLNKIEKNKFISEFTQKSEMVFSLVEKDVSSYQAVLTTLQSFYDNSEDVNRKEFKDFTRTLDANHPEIQALGWVPRRLMSPSGSFPVHYVEPLDGNESLLSTDLGLNSSVKDLFQKAGKDKKLVSIAPISLPELKGLSAEPFLALALGSEHGVLFEVVHLNKILTTISEFLNDPSYRVQISDVTAGTSQFIFDSVKTADATTQQFYRKELTWFSPIAVGDRLWQITLYQDLSLRTNTAFDSSIFLFATLLFTFLICSLLLSIANSFLTVQEIVKQKTLHLRELNLQLEKASQTKSDFLANMSHEIRTPLNVVLGMADLLEESSLADEQKHYVEISKKAGQNLLNIVNDILDISKIEAGLLTLEKTDVDISELAADVQEMFLLKAHEKGLEIKLNVHEDAHNIYQGDSMRIRQILFNLVANAVKFTAEGHIDITVSANTDSQRPGNILFQVTDTGIGISSDKLAHLFQPFTQADSTITRRYGGTGLGLSICKRLTTMMNGDIQVQSQPLHGSTFSFTLDLPLIKKSDKNPKKKPVDTSVTSEYMGTPLRILIVDDTEDNRTLIKAFLKDTPHTLLETDNGVKALEIFKEDHLDLILMDMQMPIMDGFNATLEIRKIEKSEHRAPTQIWALTAYALKNEIERSLEVGCNLHLVKPIKRAELLSHIHEMINARQNK